MTKATVEPMNLETISEGISNGSTGNAMKRRSHGKRHDQQPTSENISRKRPKHESKPSLEAAELSSEQGKLIQTASFRHLFSFGENDATPKPSAAGKSFSLFGEAQDNTSNKQYKLFDEQEGFALYGNGTHGESLKADDHVTNGSELNARFSKNDGGIVHNMFDKSQEKIVPQRVPLNVENRLATSGGKLQMAQSSIVTIDDIDTSPEAIFAIAKQFCRSKDLEQLEKEWCEENGIRDQMKKDFRAKRSKGLKEKHLRGSSD